MQGTAIFMSYTYNVVFAFGDVTASSPIMLLVAVRRIA